MQFSVIVPVYNVEQYLPRCLDSILNQQFRDFEVLVVDDGSTDGSGKLCDEYAKRDNRIRVIHQENQGLSGARNTGLDHAQGTWIAFVDSDDWVAEDMLQRVKRAMERMPADLYSFNVSKASEDGLEEIEKLIFFIENDVFSIKDEDERLTFYTKKLLQYKMGWEVCFRVFNRKIIEQSHLRFHPTSEIYAEDLLFTAQYCLHIRKYAVICNLLYRYRQRSGSLLGTRNISTVLPRINRLSEILYEDMKRKKWKAAVKNFHEIYFYLLNYQIQYTLKNESDEQIAAMLKALPLSPNQQKWLEAARTNRFSYRKVMVNHQWL